jgi:hypothetical protein
MGNGKDGAAEGRGEADLRPLNFLFKVIQVLTAPLDWKVVTPLAAAWVAYVYSLPQAERSTKAVESVEKLAQLAGGGLIAWLGWAVAFALVAVGLPYYFYSQRRINSLGEYQRKQRNIHDPKRLSSLHNVLDGPHALSEAPPKGQSVEMAEPEAHSTEKHELGDHQEASEGDPKKRRPN